MKRLLCWLLGHRWILFQAGWGTAELDVVKVLCCTRCEKFKFELVAMKYGEDCFPERPVEPLHLRHGFNDDGSVLWATEDNHWPYKASVLRWVNGAWESMS